MRKNNRAARAARLFDGIFSPTVVCQTTTWNFHTLGSDDNASPQGEIFYMKTIIHAKQENVQFAYFAQRDRHGKIAKNLTLKCDIFFVASVVVSKPTMLWSTLHLFTKTLQYNTTLYANFWG